MKARREEDYTMIVGAGFVLALVIVSAAIWVLKQRPGGNGNTPATPEATQDKEKKGKDKKDKKQPSSEAKKWAGDKAYESSGAIWVPGTDQVLFVDDKDDANILCVTLNENADQSGDLIPVALGAKVDDAEDITSDGTYFYVISSQFRKKSNEGAGIVRFRYDPSTHTVQDLQAIQDLKGLLIKNVPELAVSKDEVRTENAINIEGLAWDPKGKRLLFGFRDPLVNGSAMIVPAMLKDPNAGFTADNLSFAPAIKLNLEGLAIRSIEWDATKTKFLIIAGATEGEKKEGFFLWSWDGSGAPQKLQELDAKIKPEGITSVDAGGDHFLYVVGDAGYYLRLADPVQ
ncbi:MAG: DUF3616 domain-containing protein [Pyrinomonadaceae bacterium]